MFMLFSSVGNHHVDVKPPTKHFINKTSNCILCKTENMQHSSLATNTIVEMLENLCQTPLREMSRSLYLKKKLSLVQKREI